MDTGKIVRYEHHGVYVAVMEEHKGLHWDFCLCGRCEHLNKDNRDENCQIANLLYEMCKTFSLVTPVWECHEFEEKK